MECSICLQPVQEDSENAVTLDCGHTFHLKCINMWLNFNNTCPNCRKIVLTQFKCKYSPYPFLPFFGKKDCVFKIKENSIIIHFVGSPHLRHFFNLTDIQKVMLVGESIILRHKVGEDSRGNYKFKNFSYDFVYTQNAINIFNSICNKLNLDYVTSRNYVLQ